jgi:hypothetical protein
MLEELYLVFIINLLLFDFMDLSMDRTQNLSFLRLDKLVIALLA